MNQNGISDVDFLHNQTNRPAKRDFIPDVCHFSFFLSVFMITLFEYHTASPFSGTDCGIWMKTGGWNCKPWAYCQQNLNLICNDIDFVLLGSSGQIGGSTRPKANKKI